MRAPSSKNHLIEYKIQSQYSVQTFARIEENCWIFSKSLFSNDPNQESESATKFSTIQLKKIDETTNRIKIRVLRCESDEESKKRFRYIRGYGELKIEMNERCLKKFRNGLNWERRGWWKITKMSSTLSKTVLWSGRVILLVTAFISIVWTLTSLVWSWVMRYDMRFIRDVFRDNDFI